VNRIEQSIKVLAAQIAELVMTGLVSNGGKAA
jgi:hypothetical protein